jgi:hypothetical protein
VPRGLQVPDERAGFAFHSNAAAAAAYALESHSTPSVSAERLRLDGNAAFKEKNFAAAEKLYTASLERMQHADVPAPREQRVQVLNNRAAARLSQVRTPCSASAVATALQSVTSSCSDRQECFARDAPMCV